jgi:plasmid replication initiation protein
MEHPFYSLSKKPETTVRRYEHNGNWIEVVPSVRGLATIYDKDILIYCISQIVAKMKAGEPISKRVRINSRELLMFTNRGTAGKDYKALCDALDRLDGTRIRTNIRRGDGEQFNAFGLIDSASVARKFGLDGRLMWCDVTLSDWVFEAIRGREVLTLHRDYFRLRKPLERRIYEIARKHCGAQSEWSVRVETLHKKSGSKATIREFRRVLREIAEFDHLPDYKVAHDAAKDKVIFRNRGTVMPTREVPKPGQPGFYLDPDTYSEARAVAPEWDVYYLEREFQSWIAGKEPPRNPDLAFVSFCRKWFQNHGRP